MRDRPRRTAKGHRHAEESQSGGRLHRYTDSSLEVVFAGFLLFPAKNPVHQEPHPPKSKVFRPRHKSRQTKCIPVNGQTPHEPNE